MVKIKEPQLFVHRSSFDHPEYAVTKRLHIFLFSFTTAILKFGGHVIHRWKGIFKTFPAVYHKPPNS
jgi:hypothetical protein